LHSVLRRIREEKEYDWIDVVDINLQDLDSRDDANIVAQRIAERIFIELGIDKTERPIPKHVDELHEIFTSTTLQKPLILIMDEFDALQPQVIKSIAGVLRNVYIHRQKQYGKQTAEKYYMLHGVALIGVRSVLGIESKSGSPFNTQRSVNIPNLTEAEVNDLFQQYIAFSGQEIKQDVIDRIYYEFRGQPGLTCWFGELLTEKFNPTPDQPITMTEFNLVYNRAQYTEPNSNIINLIQKAHEPAYKDHIMRLFQTSDKVRFSFDDNEFNFLYMNGVIDYEEEEGNIFVKFPNPFVHKRLFNSFSREMFEKLGKLHDPFIDISSSQKPRSTSPICSSCMRAISKNIGHPR